MYYKKANKIYPRLIIDKTYYLLQLNISTVLKELLTEIKLGRIDTVIIYRYINTSNIVLNKLITILDIYTCIYKIIDETFENKFIISKVFQNKTLVFKVLNSQTIILDNKSIIIN